MGSRQPDASWADIDSGVIRHAIPPGHLGTAEIGLEERVRDASRELLRFVKIFRLPDRNSSRSLRLKRRISLNEAGDNPIYMRLTQDDGTRA